MGYFLTITAKIFEASLRGVGAHLCISVSGIFFMALPVTFGTAAYAMVIFQKAGLSLSHAVLLSLVVSLMLAIFFAVAYTKMSNDSYAVLTLTGVVAMEALVKSWDSVTGGMMGISGITRPELLGNLSALVMAEGILAILVITAEYLILKSGLGRQLRALKENKSALGSLGISGNRIGAMVIILASILAAAEGVLSLWRIQYLDPSFISIYILLSALTIAILAFRPRVLHLTASVIVVMLLPEFLRFLHISSVMLGQMRVLLYSLVIIFMIRFLSGRGTIAERSF